MDQSKMDSADIISFFESSMMEIEILARKKPKNGVCPVLLVHYMFRTRPEMSYQQEGYQKGPIHVGRIQINFRTYGWTPEEIENYKALRRDEDFKLLGVVDSSVKAAMDALGDELMDYLVQAGDESVKPSKSSPKTEVPSKLIPKIKIFDSFQKVFKSNRPPRPKKPKMNAEQKWQFSNARSDAEKAATKSAGTVYEHFKKHHGLMSW